MGALVGIEQGKIPSKRKRRPSVQWNALPRREWWRRAALGRRKLRRQRLEKASSEARGLGAPYARAFGLGADVPWPRGAFADRLAARRLAPGLRGTVSTGASGPACQCPPWLRPFDGLHRRAPRASSAASRCPRAVSWLAVSGRAGRGRARCIVGASRALEDFKMRSFSTFARRPRLGSSGSFGRDERSFKVRPQSVQSLPPVEACSRSASGSRPPPRAAAAAALTRIVRPPCPRPRRRLGGLRAPAAPCR
jgi:hypothetical protein